MNQSFTFAESQSLPRTAVASSEALSVGCRLYRMLQSIESHKGSGLVEENHGLADTLSLCNSSGKLTRLRNQSPNKDALLSKFEAIILLFPI